MKPWHLAVVGSGLLFLIFALSFVDSSTASAAIVLLWLICFLTFAAAGVFALVRLKTRSPRTAAGWQHTVGPPIGQPDLTAKLTQLAHLKATGALNDQEYAAAKERAIAGN